MTFLITDIDEDQQIQTKGTIQLCNNTFNFYHNNTLYQIPCIVESNVRFYQLGTDETKYISEPSTNIIIRIPNTEITSQIQRNQIYKLGISNYKVIDISDILEPGLIILKLEYTVEEIEEYVFTLEILNGDLLNIQQGNNLQLNIRVKDGTNTITPSPPCLFISSNENILTVDSNGLVTTVGIGTATITCKLQNDETVYDTINITVEEIPVLETYTLELIGNIQPDTEIKQNQTIIYTCVKRNSLGEIVDDAMFNFSIVAGSTPSSAYTFTVLNNNQCSIKCNSPTYYIDLVAVDKSNSSLTVSKHIKLRAIF
jgi:hypothetical protein